MADAPPGTAMHGDRSAVETDPITAGERFVEGFRASLANIQATDQRLQQLEAEPKTDEIRRLERELHDRESAYHAAVADCEQQAKTSAAAAASDFHRETAAAKGDYQDAIANLWESIESQKKRAVEQCDEKSWMTSSIVDDQSESSPKRRYENTRGLVERTAASMSARLEELQRIHERAASRFSAAETSEAAGPTGDIPKPQTLSEASQAFENAASIVERQAGLLERRRFLRFFGLFNSTLIGLIVGGIVFAVLAFAVGAGGAGLRNLSPSQWLAASGVVGLVCLLMIAIGLYQFAQAQLAAAYRPLRDAFRSARVLLRSWEQHAFRELDERREQMQEYEATSVARREQTLERFAKERDERLAELDEELRVSAAAAEQQMRERLQAAQQQYDTRVQAIENERQATLRRLEQEFATARDELQSQLQELTTGHHEQIVRSAEELVNDWQRTRTEFLEGIAQTHEAVAREFPPLEAVLERGWEPARVTPRGIPLGNYVLSPEQLGELDAIRRRNLPLLDDVRLPLLLRFPDQCSLLVKTGPEATGAATHVAQLMILRLLALLPPGTARFTLVDPVGLGESFSTFMHLTDYDELLVTHRIWTESHHIEAQLAKLTEHIENVLQKYLRNDFPTLEDYNRHAGEVAEPYRFLVVSGFPSAFSERAAQRLTSIAASGPRCGVYLILLADPRQEVPRGFQLADIERVTTVFHETRQGLVQNALGAKDVAIELDPLPSPAEFTSIVKTIGEHSRDTRRVEVPFARISPPPADMWSADSRRGLEIPLGRSGATKLQSMRLGSGTSQHALVAGRTGSGKSTLLHVLIMNAALRYSPDELEFFLIDFKKGVEFKPYASGRLPHARVVAIESDREFGVSVLERLDQILKERGELFREQGVQDIAAFRQLRPDERMPRILLLVDEFQEFFVEDDGYSQTATLLLDRLVRQGRAFGIHVLLGSQTLGGAYSLARTTISQMGVRVALQCSETDAHLILSEDNTAARLLTRPGEAIYNDANGMVEGNSTFQVAWLSDEQQREHLERIVAKSTETGRRDPLPVVFEGNRRANLLENLPRIAQLRPLPTGDADPVTFWLGEPVAIADPTAVPLKRMPGHNVAVISPDERAGAELVAAMVLSDLAMRPATAGSAPAEQPRFDVLADEGPARECWNLLAENATTQVTLRPADAAGEVVGDLAEELTRRRDDKHVPRTPRVLVVSGLESAAHLRKSEDDFGFGNFDRDQPPHPGRQFSQLLKEGPAVGIHVVISCVSYNTFDRWLGRNMLREFGFRIAFQLSATDSSMFVDSPLASRLGPQRALLYRDQQGTSEKFRPFAFPEAETLRQHFAPTAPAGDDDDLEVADSLDSWQIV